MCVDTSLDALTEDLSHMSEEEKKEDKKEFRVWQPIYDRVWIDKQTVSATFFQTALGGMPKPARLVKDAKTAIRDVKPHTQVDTNLDMAGEMPSSRHFCIEGLSLVTDVDPDKLEHYLQHSWVRLSIDARDYLVLPAIYLHQDIDDFDINEPIFEWPEPIELPPQTKYKVEINTPYPVKPGGFYMSCILHGYFKRQMEAKASDEKT